MPKIAISKSSDLILIMIGVFLIPVMNAMENVLSSILLLVGDFSLMSKSLISVIAGSLNIFLLIYAALVIYKQDWNRTIDLSISALKWIGALFLGVLLLSMILNYLQYIGARLGFNLGIQQEDTYFQRPNVYLQATAMALPFVERIVLFVIYFLLLRNLRLSDNDSSTKELT